MRFDFEGRKCFDTSFNYRNQLCLISILHFLSHFRYIEAGMPSAASSFSMCHEFALGSKRQSDQEEHTSLSSFELQRS